MRAINVWVLLASLVFTSVTFAVQGQSGNGGGNGDDDVTIAYSKRSKESLQKVFQLRNSRDQKFQALCGAIDASKKILTLNARTYGNASKISESCKRKAQEGLEVSRQLEKLRRLFIDNRVKTNNLQLNKVITKIKNVTDCSGNGDVNYWEAKVNRMNIAYSRIARKLAIKYATKCGRMSVPNNKWNVSRKICLNSLGSLHIFAGFLELVADGSGTTNRIVRSCMRKSLQGKRAKIILKELQRDKLSLLGININDEITQLSYDANCEGSGGIKYWSDKVGSMNIKYSRIGLAIANKVLTKCNGFHPDRDEHAKVVNTEKTVVDVKRACPICHDGIITVDGDAEVHEAYFCQVCGGDVHVHTVNPITLKRGLRHNNEI